MLPMTTMTACINLCHTRSILQAVFCNTSHSPLRRIVSGSRRFSKDTARDIRDEAIPTSHVYVVRDADNGQKSALDGPIPLRQALQKRKSDEKGRAIEYLKMVRDRDEKMQYPICRYFDKVAERQREKERRKAQKGTKIQHKALELNWTVGPNDLSHRMAKMHEFLQRGARVEVTIGSARKRGWMDKRTDDEQAASNLVNDVRAAAMAVPGTRERGQLQGALGQTVKLNFEGKRVSPGNP